MMTFMLSTSVFDNLPHIDRWIEFAVSRKVENLTLKIHPRTITCYKIPDSLYTNSSVKQLSVELSFDGMIPGCAVSWTSLKSLSLNPCKLSDESIANILSGCPIFETLKLYFCNQLRVLDLSQTLRLKTLEIYRNSLGPGPKQIVAPHIHVLALRLTKELACTLVDVSSLKEAKLEISFDKGNVKAGVLQYMALEMLEKLQNVEKLIFRENFLKILSRAELRRVPLPKFMVKDLILVTKISHYVIPGIVRVLQNSPELKKLTIHAMNTRSNIPEEFLDIYFKWHGSNLNQCWISEARVFENIFHRKVVSNDVARFMELMLKNTKTIEKMVVRLERYLEGRDFEELLPMVPMLFHHNDISIVLSSTKPKQRVAFNLIGPSTSSLILNNTS